MTPTRKILSEQSTKKSLFTRLITALNRGEYDKASALQTEIYNKVEELKFLYDAYEKNII